MRSGQTLEVKAAISRRGKVAEEASVWVEFYAPGRVPGGLERPHRTVKAAFDPQLRKWVAQVRTRDWPPGQWHFRVVAHNARAAGVSGLSGATGDYTFDLAA